MVTYLSPGNVYVSSGTPVAAVVALLMIIIAIANQKSTSVSLQEANSLHQHHLGMARRDIANTEVVAAMGMLDVIKQSWRTSKMPFWNCSRMRNQTGFFSASQRHLGSPAAAAIATGAFLVLQQEISPGMLIAGSILVGRARNPLSWLLDLEGFCDGEGAISEPATSV